MAETKRGRASKPVMDYSAVAATAVEEDEPLTVQRQKEANPFIDNVKASVENETAYSFGNLQGALAGKQVVSLLSRAAEQLDYGMSTRILKQSSGEPLTGDELKKFGGKVKVVWQAKAERIRRPRKDKAEDEATEDEGSDAE